MALARPPARHGPSAAAWLYTRLRHRRGLRLAAAAGAAVAVLVALGSNNSSERSPSAATALTSEDAGASQRLAPGTRGVTVPAGGIDLRVGDIVDVHEIRTGGAVVRAALVADAADEHILVAVPLERVDAMLDALTTGGVMLVLVPPTPMASPQ